MRMSMLTILKVFTLISVSSAALANHDEAIEEGRLLSCLIVTDQFSVQVGEPINLTIRTLGKAAWATLLVAQQTFDAEVPVDTIEFVPTKAGHYDVMGWVSDDKRFKKCWGKFDVVESNH